MNIKNAVNSKSSRKCLKCLKLPSELKSLSFDECNRLCEEIRSILIDTVSVNGGHLASNLGTVELTMALHRVFNSPADKILWDVGHQAYTHKLLTGRFGRFYTLRQEGGISGFPKPSESEHDAFISGHSSNSISAACGIAQGMKLLGKNDYTIAVIGDGAFTGGMAYEGLNNAGKSNTNLIIILNHNDMSISKNVGAFAKYLTTIRAKPEYLETKNAVQKVLDKTPIVGKPLKKAIKASKSVLKGMLYHSTMFEDFGFVYLGPVDGHNLEEMEKILLMAKKLQRPTVIHINTVKGKGYAPAEANPGAFHGISKNEILMGNPEVISEDSYSAVFGRELTKIAREDKKICAITAAMKYGTGLQYFANEHRERFFDVGIAEQHAVTFAAGLAKSGLIPVFAVYSSFLQRAFDQVLHDASIDKTHVVIGIDRAGIVGEDGETHQGIFDVAILSSIPNITIYSPSGYEELKNCLFKAIYQNNGVVAVRYPRGSDNFKHKDLNINEDYVYVDNSSDILVVTYGRIYHEVLMAKKLLFDQEIFVDTLKLIKIFPFHKDIIGIISKYKQVFFFEEGIEDGGISQKIASILMTEGFKGTLRIAAINGFVPQATVERSLKKYNLHHETMLEFLKQELL